MAIAEDVHSGAIKTFDWISVPNGWKFELVGNVATVRRGASPRPAGDPRYFGGTIPWFKIGDATRSPSRYLSTTEEFVNEEGVKHSVKVPAGSLIVSNSGVSLGFAVITKVDGCIHDGWLLLELLDGVERDYLYYCINLLTPRIRQMADGTTQPNLNTDIARRLLIPLPPKGEQLAISSLLGALDDKIELNRRMNEALEAMARAIFKSWFVDFDPVRAKAEGRQPFGMDAATAALFPDSFQDSPLGKIPKGWHVGSVSEEFNLTMGQSPPGSTYNEVGEGTPFFQGRTDFGFRYPTERVYCTAPTRFASTGDTLVSVRAPVGDINMAALKCAVGRGVAALRHKTGSRSFTYYAMKNLQEEFANFEAEGTVFGAISKKGFAEVSWIVPPVSLVEGFEKLAFPLDQAIENNENVSKTLAAIRDALLPKLISGEIRIKDAETLVAQST